MLFLSVTCMTLFTKFYFLKFEKRVGFWIYFSLVGSNLSAFSCQFLLNAAFYLDLILLIVLFLYNEVGCLILPDLKFFFNKYN